MSQIAFLSTFTASPYRPQPGPLASRRCRLPSAQPRAPRRTARASAAPQPSQHKPHPDRPVTSRQKLLSNVLIGARRLFSNIQSFFRMSETNSVKEMQRTLSSQADVLSSADPEQARLMAECVIQVDRNDDVVGPISKKESHLVSNDLPLHRAFSLLLFDSSNRLLLQQRAAAKVTFPSFWTNTVCSHPLHTPEELATAENDPVLGVKRATIRKLSHELGVRPGSLKTEDLSFLTRIHYRAECDDKMWGEHEIDYIFFARADLELDPNPNEVDEVRYVTQHELKQLFTDASTNDDLRITPWFQHIMKGFAWQWWDALEAEGMAALERFRDPSTIHRM